MKGEFLLEIGGEEIPASFMLPAMEALAELFSKAMENARIPFGRIETGATPRRLVLAVSDVEGMQQARNIEKTGPPKAQAFDESGNPTKAAIGFAKSQGVDVNELVIVNTPKGEHVAVRKTEKGQPTRDVLAALLPGLLERIPFPKTMRWMDQDVRFARPIHWIVALYDGEVVPFSFGNIVSGNQSRGHRFTHPAPFPVTSFQDLKAKLEAQHIFLDPSHRQRIIRERLEDLAHAEGVGVFEDFALLEEVSFLVESPYPVMGTFPADFLELPASILITCMKKHQRYFSCQDSNGRITNRFIAVNNTPVKDPAVSVKGHERVLKARLEDARFYFREDRKRPLFSRLDALRGVTFHSLLGTAYEKVQRFTALAKELASRLVPEKLALVERAALLCKCDLETGIVYEFPELQGIIGSFYAKMDGENPEVCRAIREHYLPAHAGDKLPEGIVGAVVSIADRMDTIAGCFSVGLIPTGTADPYALRRHALGIIQIVLNLNKPISLNWLITQALQRLEDKRTRNLPEIEADVKEFLRARFVHYHTARDYPLDVVEAAVRAGFDDLVDARRRIDALAEWKRSEDVDALIIGFKRVVNILKNTGNGELSEGLFVEGAEKALYESFQRVNFRAAPLIADGDYSKALEALVELKGPIDTFFDKVMVMVEDDTLRNNRLALLRRIAGLFQRIADFSFIGSTADGK